MFPFRRLPLIAAALGLSAPVHAASLTALLDRVPAPPQDVATALAWVEHGRVVHPEMLALREAIAAERAQIAALNGGVLPEPGPAPTAPPEEVPEVRGALRGYGEYLSANSGKQAPEAAVGKRARWLHAAMSGRLSATVGAMTPCPHPCSDAQALAHNEASAPARRELAEQDLQQWRALFEDWRGKRRALVASAQGLIEAAGEGAKALTAAGRSGLAAYRAAMLREVEAALSVTELALKRSYAIESGDVDAISGSTYSPKKKG